MSTRDVALVAVIALVALHQQIQRLHLIRQMAIRQAANEDHLGLGSGQLGGGLDRAYPGWREIEEAHP